LLEKPPVLAKDAGQISRMASTETVDLDSLNPKQLAKQYKSMVKEVKSKDLDVKLAAIRKVMDEPRYMFDGGAIIPFLESLAPKKKGLEYTTAGAELLVEFLENAAGKVNATNARGGLCGVGTCDSVLRHAPPEASLKALSSLGALLSYTEVVKPPKKGQPPVKVDFTVQNGLRRSGAHALSLLASDMLTAGAGASELCVAFGAVPQLPEAFVCALAYLAPQCVVPEAASSGAAESGEMEEQQQDPGSPTGSADAGAKRGDELERPVAIEQACWAASALLVSLTHSPACVAALLASEGAVSQLVALAGLTDSPALSLRCLQCLLAIARTTRVSLQEAADAAAAADGSSMSGSSSSSASEAPWLKTEHWAMSQLVSNGALQTALAQLVTHSALAVGSGGGAAEPAAVPAKAGKAGKAGKGAAAALVPEEPSSADATLGALGNRLEGVAAERVSLAIAHTVVQLLTFIAQQQQQQQPQQQQQQQPVENGALGEMAAVIAEALATPAAARAVWALGKGSPAVLGMRARDFVAETSLLLGTLALADEPSRAAVCRAGGLGLLMDVLSSAREIALAAGLNPEEANQPLTATAAAAAEEEAGGEGEGDGGVVEGGVTPASVSAPDEEALLRLVVCKALLSLFTRPEAPSSAVQAQTTPVRWAPCDRQRVDSSLFLDEKTDEDQDQQPEGTEPSFPGRAVLAGLPSLLDGPDQVSFPPC
jgi:hypothetical protein